MLDEIPPEVWKTRKFDDILLRHCNAVYIYIYIYIYIYSGKMYKGLNKTHFYKFMIFYFVEWREKFVDEQQKLNVFSFKKR